MKEEYCEVRQLTDRAEKMRFMEVCDAAFTISVIGRDSFPELLDKIDRKAIMLGLYTAEEPAGYAAFYANDREGRKAFLTLFCIRPERQRKHLGSLLMEKCLLVAGEQGMHSMGLEVLVEDDGPIAFYRRMGFEKTGQGKPGFLRMERKVSFREE